MKDGQFYQISGWMGKHLGLRGNELICFAIIYGFSMDGESQFKGNLTYLTGCMFCSKPTALLSLGKLLDCNLILKQEEIKNGKKHCYYATNVIYDEGEFSVVDSTKEPLTMTGKEPLTVTGKESLTKNNNIIEQYNKDKKGLSDDKPKSGEYSLDFIQFWELYHNGSKQQAFKEWKKLKDKERLQATEKVGEYLLYCKYSGRKQKDTSSYLHQKGFNEDWLVVPECYKFIDGEDERLHNFKEYMVTNHSELIYHRNPLTFEQGSQLLEKYKSRMFEWAFRKLKLRDIHQYFSIMQGMEAVLSEIENDNTFMED